MLVKFHFILLRLLIVLGFEYCLLFAILGARFRLAHCAHVRFIALLMACQPVGLTHTYDILGGYP